MKIATRSVRDFLANQYQKYPLIVLYGHAQDVMQQYQQQLLAQAGVDTQDAFGYTRLAAEDIANDTGMLLSEASSSSLTMQTRWIITSGKTAQLDKALSIICALDNPERIQQNRLLISLSDLTAKAALLKKLSNCEWAAAIPCYEADQRQFKQAIQDFLDKTGLRCSSEAENTLVNVSGQNLVTLQQLLGKIGLLLVPPQMIQSEHIYACSDDAQQFGLQQFALVAFNGNASKTDEQYNSLIEQKNSEIAFIRVLMQHCLKLLRLQSQANSIGIESAIQKSQPPIFFKDVEAIQHQCQKFSSAQLHTFLQQFIQLEVQAKSSEQFNPAQIRQLLLRLAKR